MKVIAVANQKGGVGKTTITRELSACCALRGYRVLAIDSDPQGNLTTSWVEQVQPDWPMLAHVVIEPSRESGARPMSLEDAIASTPVDNLDIVMSDIKLARFELQPDYMSPRLRNESRKLADQYDLIFIDCPPQLGKLMVSVFYAADYVLIPCECDVIGLSGLDDLDFTIERVRENLNPDIKRLGAVMNRYKPNRRASGEARRIISNAEQLVGPLFDTNIHDYSKIMEAPSVRAPVVEYAPNHNAADQLWSLTDEVLDRLKLTRSKIAAVR